MTADVAYGAAWSLQVQIKAPSREGWGLREGATGDKAVPEEVFDRRG
jgi:hypothetical protein